MVELDDVRSSIRTRRRLLEEEERVVTRFGVGTRTSLAEGIDLFPLPGRHALVSAGS